MRDIPTLLNAVVSKNGRNLTNPLWKSRQPDRQTIRLLAWLESREAQGTEVHARTNKKEKEGLFPKLIKTIRRDASKASPSDTPL
jgi:hypothetical protein